MNPDCVPNWVLKSNSLILALPIASILNASIQQSLVPTIWKKADVIPIQKVKNLNYVTDLRPISLTPTLAKICERFIADWLMKSIIDKIDKRQYGSLKRSSTTHALLSFIHHLLSRSDEQKNVIRIFLLDFAKTFDHIDHKILLRKLSSIEVPPIIISNVYNMSGRVVSDIQTRAEGESLYIRYNTDANVVNNLKNDSSYEFIGEVISKINVV